MRNPSSYCLVPLFFALTSVACGGAEVAKPGKDAKGTGGDGAGGAGGASAFFGGASSQDGETVKPDVCDKSALDEPDAEFLDENCDGIDGDKSKAIFVSPVGDDDFAGTMEKPVASLTKALVLAASQEKDVYVCTATYPEALTFGAGSFATRIFGGYACLDGWSRTKVAAEVAPTSGLALDIVDTAEDLSFSLLKFVSKDAPGAGQSSIAARIVRAKSVKFDRVDFRAGNGASGIDAAPTTPYTSPAADGAKGASAPLSADFSLTNCTYTTGTWPATVKHTKQDAACKARVSLASTIPKPWVCTAADKCAKMCESDGGTQVATYSYSGGNGANHYAHYNVFDPSPVPAVTAKDSKPAPVTAPAVAPAPGADGNASTLPFGTLDAAGNYLPTNSGAVGSYGKVGTQGMKGGSGTEVNYVLGGTTNVYGIGGAGGATGYPGCGGRPGAGGGGGGASIALVVIDSGVSLERGSLSTGQGGRGGNPAAGVDGQLGGKGGAGGKNSSGGAGLSGSNGLQGGRGGDGGAGAGGPSIAVVWSGTMPTLSGVTYATGVGGLGAEGPAFNPMNGANGLTQDVYEVAK